MLEVPHVRFLNQKLNLYMKDMVEADHQMKTTLDSIHITLSDCRSKLHNRAILGHTTDFVPVLQKETR